MKIVFGASVTIALATAATIPAAAATLPEVKVAASNQVPQCATPGRLMAYLHTRNPNIDPRFEGLATEYMRHGEALGIRWDMAFFQMILETGALRYNGDVRADQNNFAGLGASGGGARGERFDDISSGVKAHLQHLLMYAGDHIDDPVAERTRKVQEWGVLTKWQQSLGAPVTFDALARQWAPGSRGYVRDIATISEIFYDSHCNAPDPQPQLVQEARSDAATQVAAASAPPAADVVNEPQAPATAEAFATTAETPREPAAKSGADVAMAAIEQARKEDPPRAALGAGMLGTVAESAKAVSEVHPQDKSGAEPAVTLLNPSEPDAKETAAVGGDATGTVKTAAQTANVTVEPINTPNAASTPKGDSKTTAGKGATVQTASVAGAATQMQMPPPAKASGKCKVWTASYGGQRAVLIKAVADSTVNYTVLDVNEAAEKREVDAYIAAYAKGGENIGAFTNQTKALDKAFELCPEG